jgi:hypothetical protein
METVADVDHASVCRKDGSNDEGAKARFDRIEPLQMAVVGPDGGRMEAVVDEAASHRESG